LALRRRWNCINSSMPHSLSFLQLIWDNTLSN
jgi:hypothetical protein